MRQIRQEIWKWKYFHKPNRLINHLIWNQHKTKTKNTSLKLIPDRQIVEKFSLINSIRFPEPNTILIIYLILLSNNNYYTLSISKVLKRRELFVFIFYSKYGNKEQLKKYSLKTNYVRILFSSSSSHHHHRLIITTTMGNHHQ